MNGAPTGGTAEIKWIRIPSFRVNLPPTINIVRGRSCDRSRCWLLFLRFCAGQPLGNLKPFLFVSSRFRWAYLDRLNNLNTTVPQKSLKDIQKKLDELGDVCYSDSAKTDLVFFIHTTPAVYHGTHVYTNNSSSAAAVSDGDGGGAAAASTSTSTTAVPFEVDYSVFILDIETRQPDGTFKYPSNPRSEGPIPHDLWDWIRKGQAPAANVIEAGARWLFTRRLPRNKPSEKW